MSYLDALNTAQKEAVVKKDGALLVLAGAGAGKTRVITYRVAHLIAEGAMPERILAVTFTNKAAREMRERVENLLRDIPECKIALREKGRPHVSTFHSLCVSILRAHANEIGRTRNFAIYDRSDSIRAIKESVIATGLDPKQFDPRKFLGAISKQKGNAVSLGAYREEAGDEYMPRLIARVWEQYDRILREEKALDFDDLLLATVTLFQKNDTIRKHYQQRWQYLHIDEYQDTNNVQYELARMLAQTHGNICVVGDIDQCLAGGTQVTMADGAARAIERITKGDMVLSNYGGGDMRGAEVLRTYARRAKKERVAITTERGRQLCSTPEHVHMAGYVFGITPQLYFTYAMWKNGTGWRLGTSATYTKGRKQNQIGFIQRSNQEHADAVWVLAAERTPQAARILEYTLSLKYQIPTLPFVARNTRHAGGYVHDQSALARIFASFDTETNARKLLADYGLSFEAPHHRPRATRSNRHNITVTLCGDRRGRTPMHRISVIGSDAATKKKLGSIGLSVRPAKKGSAVWRCESARSSYAEIKETAGRIQKMLSGARIVETARLGKRTGPKRRKNALPLLPASSVRVGMALFDERGGYDLVTGIRTGRENGRVYDLDIRHTHNFIANGIVTHNSIYSWRGARIDNMLLFDTHFPNAHIVRLEQNYRSTKSIVQASNEIIQKNKNRQEKTVFTDNPDGERIALYSALNEADEARRIAEEAGSWIERGVRPSEIAVLYRANFQSRILEELFLSAGIPYQVLGVRFFERREVKDMLAYLRAALDDGNISDFKRVINIPKRGIGKATVLKIVMGKEAELPAGMRARIAAFRELLAQIGEKMKTAKPSETVRFVLEESGIREELEKGSADDVERLENIEELVTLARKYDLFAPEEGIQRLLDDAALASDQDDMDEKQNAVRLMTVHSAKGLEFDYVFITGLEERLFPHERHGEHDDEEEERRLFYVALTRARKKVVLSYAQIRTVFGAERMSVPSEFITDIDEGYLEELPAAAHSSMPTIHML